MMCSPQKTVMLAIDGPAPLAKLVTQRERRKVCRAHARLSLLQAAKLRSPFTCVQWLDHCPLLRL